MTLLRPSVLLVLGLACARASRAEDARDGPETLFAAGRIAEADAAYRTAYEAASRDGDLGGQARALRGRIRCAQRMLDFASVVDAANRLEALEVRRGDAFAATVAAADRAAALLDSGRVDEARSLLLSVRQRLLARPPTAQLDIVEQNLAKADSAQGRYAAALAWAEDVAARASRPTSDVAARRSAFNTHASILLQLGDASRAAALWRSLLDEHPAPTGVERAELLGSLSQALADAGEEEAALVPLRAAIAEFDAAGAGRGSAVGRMTLASVLRRLGRLDEALAAARDSQRASRSDPTLTAYADYEEAATLVARGERGRARAPLDRARSRAEAAGDLDLGIACDIEATEVAVASGDPIRAWRSARDALVRVTESAAGLSDDGTAVARAQRARLYRLSILSARATKDGDVLFEATERCRAAGLLSTIGGRRSLRASDRAEGVEAEVAELERDEGRLRDEFERALETSGSRDRVVSARRAADDALARLDRARERLQRERLVRSTREEPCTLAEVRARLRPSDLFASVSTSTAEAFAIVVEKDSSPRLVELGSTAELLASADEIRADFDDEATSRLAAFGRRLETLGVVSPRADRLLLTVDGNLAAVPFGAAFELQARPRSVVLLPSATVWRTLASTSVVTDRPRLAIGVGSYALSREAAGRQIFLKGRSLPDLPNAAAEARHAAGPSGVALVDADAVESSVRARLEDPAGWDLVHMACHGFFDPVAPTLSGLALRPDARSDGFLHGREILDSRIRANLVVLSACDTGRGRVYQGEGVWGLARAFMLAGAPRVLVSLWRTDDEAAAVLMRDFHDRCRRGEPPEDALRTAQSAIRSRDRWRHPRYWAPWQLWGIPTG